MAVDVAHNMVGGNGGCVVVVVVWWLCVFPQIKTRKKCKKERTNNDYM